MVSPLARVGPSDCSHRSVLDLGLRRIVLAKGRRACVVDEEMMRGRRSETYRTNVSSILWCMLLLGCDRIRQAFLAEKIGTCSLTRSCIIMFERF